MSPSSLPTLPDDDELPVERAGPFPGWARAFLVGALLMLVVVVLVLLGLSLITGSGAPEFAGSRVAQAPAAPEAGGRGPDAEAAPPAAEAVPRKIIYNAQVTLLVEEFEPAEAQLQQILQEEKGYIARSDIQGSSGSRRVGTWTLRVPMDRFDAFLQRLAGLGELQRKGIDSEDITDRYYDLAARIRNKEAHEEKLRDYLKNQAKTPADFMAIDDRLTQVQAEIEVGKGQLNRWDKLTQLATVTLTMQERRTYVPPGPTTPTFSTAIGRTFDSSITSLVAVGQFLILAAVAIAPWLTIVAAIAIPAWLMVRRQRRSVERSSGAG